MQRICGLMILGCIAFSILSATAGLGAATGSLAEADGLLTSPALSMTQATRALSLYEGLLATAGTPRALVLARLGHTCFLLGQLAPDSQKMGYYQKGQSYAETLIREEPNRVEGHYWLAMNLCGQADAGGKLLGHRLLPRILEELQRAVALDAAYDQAGAHRVLGRIYYEAPGWPLSVGDMQKSRQHLQAAVRLAPATSTNHLYWPKPCPASKRPAWRGRNWHRCSNPPAGPSNPRTWRRTGRRPGACWRKCRVGKPGSREDCPNGPLALKIKRIIPSREPKGGTGFPACASASYTRLRPLRKSHVG